MKIISEKDFAKYEVLQNPFFLFMTIDFTYQMNCILIIIRTILSVDISWCFLTFR